MGQVPPMQYAIIGAGRVAQHFCHYLTLLGLPYKQWSRRQNDHELTEIIHACNPILILISDADIETFIAAHPCLKEKTIVHFSGQLTSRLAWSAHPLMTFNQTLYSLTTYEKIPFILQANSPDFAELLPGLNNSFFKIKPELKAYYHALCVMSGNFTTLLWQKFFTELETTFQIPKMVAYPYLQQTLYNLQQNEKTALTGPLARNDTQTITANLHALSNDPFQAIYQAFVNVYAELRTGETAL